MIVLSILVLLLFFLCFVLLGKYTWEKDEKTKVENERDALDMTLDLHLQRVPELKRQAWGEGRNAGYDEARTAILAEHGELVRYHFPLGPAWRVPQMDERLERIKEQLLLRAWGDGWGIRTEPRWSIVEFQGPIETEAVLEMLAWGTPLVAGNYNGDRYRNYVALTGALTWPS